MSHTDEGQRGITSHPGAGVPTKYYFVGTPKAGTHDHDWPGAREGAFAHLPAAAFMGPGLRRDD
ncbi:MAG: hypothetical protein QOH47_2047 [Sphingomonadales bacterium]|jgi:hypothetical protein|nr:hypothetical protein [Sphingomonadales bacterium]